MGIDTDIRAIARDAAREVIREELKQIESSLEARRVSRPPAERLLSVEDVAGLCGVTTKTVQRWIARGLLRAIRSPGMREYRITQREYDAFTSGAAANGSAKADQRDLEAEASRAVATALAPRRAGR